VILTNFHDFSQNFYDLSFFHDFSRPGNDHFKIPWLFRVFHDRTNPDRGTSSSVNQWHNLYRMFVCEIWSFKHLRKIWGVNTLIDQKMSLQWETTNVPHWLTNNGADSFRSPMTNIVLNMIWYILCRVWTNIANHLTKYFNTFLTQKDGEKLSVTWQSRGSQAFSQRCLVDLSL